MERASRVATNGWLATVMHSGRSTEYARYSPTYPVIQNLYSIYVYFLKKKNKNNLLGQRSPLPSSQRRTPRDRAPLVDDRGHLEAHAAHQAMQPRPHSLQGFNHVI